MKLDKRIFLPVLFVGLAVAWPLGTAAQRTTKCAAEVIDVEYSKRHFRGTAIVRVIRSRPGRPVELRLSGNITYRYPGGSNSATSLSSVRIEPSKTKSEKVSVTIRPDTGDPDAWVNVHCKKRGRCKVNDISFDQITCWDYAKKPTIRLEVGEPEVKLRKSP